VKYYHNLTHFILEKWCNDDDDNDTNIHDESIEAPNDNDYPEFQAHNIIHVIGHLSK
jgi:hypothetical protein